MRLILAAWNAKKHDANIFVGRCVPLVQCARGALCDDALRARLEAAAYASGALLYVPSGGIGALDALKAAALSGMDSVTISVAKPPVAWKNSQHYKSGRQA